LNCHFGASKQLSHYEGAKKLIEKIDKPLRFKGLEPAQNPEIHGYDITVLADVCDLIVDTYNSWNHQIKIHLNHHLRNKKKRQINQYLPLA